MDPGGYGDIFNQVLTTLELINTPGKLIGGYDHGASIALRMAAKWPSRFAKVVAFHPSLANTASTKQEMAKITAEVQIQWIPADMFHNWNKWKSMIPAFKNGTLSVVKIHPWNSECAKKSYRKFSNQVCSPIVKFLTGVDHLGAPPEVHKAKEIKMKSTTGATITGRQIITFAEEITEEELKEMQSQPDMQRDALEALGKLDVKLIVEALLGSTHPRREQVIRLLRVAPDFNLDTMETPFMLQ